MTVSIKSRKPAVLQKQQQDQPATPKPEGFISKCIRIISDDIHYAVFHIRSEDRQRWEDYERFAKLARGGKR